MKNILKSKYFTKPNIKNITITLDERLIDFSNDSKYFDEFIRIKTPYFYETKKRSIKLCIPIKHHKHSNKFKTWKRCLSIQLRKINNSIYLNFIYEKEITLKRQNGITIRNWSTAQID